MWRKSYLIPLCVDYKFDLMYSKRAFVHWYVGEGMEEVRAQPIILGSSSNPTWTRVNFPRLVKILQLLRRTTKKLALILLIPRRKSSTRPFRNVFYDIHWYLLSSTFPISYSSPPFVMFWMPLILFLSSAFSVVLLSLHLRAFSLGDIPKNQLSYVCNDNVETKIMSWSDT